MYFLALRLNQNSKKSKSKIVEPEDEFDDDFDEEVSEEAYETAFFEALEDLVKQNYNVNDYFEEPSTQSGQGSDFIWITLSDGSKYKFEFDYGSMIEDASSLGIEPAAVMYFNEIKEGIDSGEALVEG